MSHSYHILRIWKEGSSRFQNVFLKLFHRETCSVYIKLRILPYEALAICEMIAQERQIIIIIGSMYIPVLWLNHLCNNFFSIFSCPVLLYILALLACVVFFYSILYLCLLTFFYLIHSWLVFLSTIIGRSVWHLVFGMNNYSRPSDCPCVFCEVFLCISLHRNLPGSLVSL